MKSPPTSKVTLLLFLGLLSLASIANYHQSFLGIVKKGGAACNHLDENSCKHCCKWNEKKGACVPRKKEKCACFLPQRAGRCDGNFTRWAFNSDESACELFTYGGCGGNTNNFETKDDCETQCAA